MQTKEVIQAAIYDAVREVTGISHFEKNASLIDKDLRIGPASFLYIFDILEKQLQVPACDIFQNHTYEVMTISNLTEALFALILR